MYLSKLSLNPARRGGRFLLANPQAMHAAVMSSFPPEDTAGKRVLWRVDRAQHEVGLYVAAPTEPDFSHLVEQAGWATSTWQTRDYRPLLERLEQGQKWAFRLHANPVKQSGSAESKGKRVAHVTPVQQVGWLVDRAEQNGFSIAEAGDGSPQVQVSSKTKTAFGRADPHHGDAKSKVTVVRAQFDGRLVVTDVERFRVALTQGIGRAKAYGCGLMTVAKAASENG